MGRYSKVGIRRVGIVMILMMSACGRFAGFLVGMVTGTVRVANYGGDCLSLFSVLIS